MGLPGRRRPGYPADTLAPVPSALSAALLAVVLAVPVGSPFGDASVDGRRLGGGMMEVEITVDGPVDAVVVAHLVPPGDGEVTVPLRERAPGVFGALTEVRAADLAVVFEIVASEPVLSEPRRLTELGLPAVVLDPGSADPSAGSLRGSLLAVGVAAGLLALVLFRAAGRSPGGPGA